MDLLNLKPDDAIVYRIHPRPGSKTEVGIVQAIYLTTSKVMRVRAVAAPETLHGLRRVVILHPAQIECVQRA